MGCGVCCGVAHRVVVSLRADTWKGREGVVKDICFGKSYVLSSHSASDVDVHLLVGKIVFGDARSEWGDVCGDAVRGLEKSGSAEKAGDRWAVDATQKVGGVPWHTSGEGEDADGPSVKAQLGGRMREPDVERAAGAAPVPPRMAIAKADLDMYGFTAECLGCRA